MMKRKALIVDDEEDTCFLLSVILKQQNYETTCCYCLGDAPSHLAQHQPSVIFLDNNLTDGLGVDIIPELLAQYPDMKIILITAFDTLPTRTRAYAKGAHYFVGKPFDRQDIYAALDSIFKDAEERRELP